MHRQLSIPGVSFSSWLLRVPAVILITLGISITHADILHNTAESDSGDMIQIENIHDAYFDMLHLFSSSDTNNIQKAFINGKPLTPDESQHLIDELISAAKTKSYTAHNKNPLPELTVKNTLSSLVIDTAKGNSLTLYLGQRCLSQPKV